MLLLVFCWGALLPSEGVSERMKRALTVLFCNTLHGLAANWADAGPRHFAGTVCIIERGNMLSCDLFACFCLVRCLLTGGCSVTQILSVGGT